LFPTAGVPLIHSPFLISSITHRIRLALLSPIVPLYSGPSSTAVTDKSAKSSFRCGTRKRSNRGPIEPWAFLATISAFPCGTKIGGMKPSSQNVQDFCPERTGQDSVDKTKIRFTPYALIARKMVGKEFAIGVVLVR
jgi:hypothetical protein